MELQRIRMAKMLAPLLVVLMTWTSCRVVPEAVPDVSMDDVPVVDLGTSFHEDRGCAVFLQGQSYATHNSDDVDRRSSPCSTFKIVSSLAILESGAIVTEEYRLPGYGIDWSPMDSWNGDLTMQEAFEASCVWYYREAIDRVGQEYMQTFLEELAYGNGDISEWQGSGVNGMPLLDGFWLESSLQISPREQVELLQRVFEGETGLSPWAVAYVKEMMRVTDVDCGHPLYGKTGTGADGWFVGFFERDSGTVYCAVRIDAGDGATAKGIAVEIIRSQYGEATQGDA